MYDVYTMTINVLRIKCFERRVKIGINITNQLNISFYRYSTGSEVSEHSVLIHEYYAREAKNPIHLTVDTALKGNKMGIKAYVSSQIGVPTKTVGCMFTPVDVEVSIYEPERVGVDIIQGGKHNPKRSVQMFSDLSQVEKACVSLQDKLGVVLQYVDDVLVSFL